MSLKKLSFWSKMTPRYLVSSFTERGVVPSFIIGFLFNVFPNTTASVLVGDIVILYLWYQLCIVLIAVFALISSSLRLFLLIRMHKSSAYAAKSVILSSLSRRPSRLSKYVFHNMSPSMESCGHPRLIFLLCILVSLFGLLGPRSKIGADCRREEYLEVPQEGEESWLRHAVESHRRSQRKSPVHKLYF